MNPTAMYRSVLNRYKPLSEEEELELIASERHNEEHLRDLLMLHSMRGAVSIAMSYCKERMDSIDDAIQRAMIGLYKASRSFDFDKGVRFFTYASWQVIHDVTYVGNTNLKDAKINARMISLDAPMSADESDDFTLADVVRNLMAADVEQVKNGNEFVDKICEDDQIGLLFNVADSCTRFGARSIEMFKKYILHEARSSFFSGKAEVGREFGVTRQCLDIAVRKVARAVRKKLEQGYSRDAEIARLVDEYHKRKEYAADKSPAYRAAVGIDEELKKEEAYIEAVKQEEPSVIERLNKLRSSLYREAFNQQGLLSETQAVSRRKSFCSRSCAKTMNYSKIDTTRQRKYKADVHFRPESMDRRLNDLFAQERMRCKLRHSSGTASLGDQRRQSAFRALHESVDISTAPEASSARPEVQELEPAPPVPTGRRDEDEPTEQDVFAAELGERIARHNEMQTANGSHFDDIYELQDEN